MYVHMYVHTYRDANAVDRSLDSEHAPNVVLHVGSLSGHTMGMCTLPGPGRTDLIVDPRGAKYVCTVSGCSSVKLKTLQGFSSSAAG
jgi:hypothetical protein